MSSADLRDLRHFTTDNGAFKCKRIELSYQHADSSFLYSGEASSVESDNGMKLSCKVKRFLSEDVLLFSELEVLRECCRATSPGYLSGFFPLYLGVRVHEDGYTCVAISRDSRPDLAHYYSIPLPEQIGLKHAEKYECFPQPIGRSVAITLEVLAALEHLHTVGYILTNIGPRNVFISEGSKYRLDATGNCHETRETFDHIMIANFEYAIPTNTHGIAHNFEFAAPELYKDSAAYQTCCEKTDCFGVIGLLIYLLTGSPPFSGTKDECEDACVNLESDNTFEKHFFGKLRQIFPDALLNNCGLEGPNVLKRNGLRHLIYNGMRISKERRWGSVDIICELKRLLKYLEGGEK